MRGCPIAEGDDAGSDGDATHMQAAVGRGGAPAMPANCKHGGARARLALADVSLEEKFIRPWLMVLGHCRDMDMQSCRTQLCTSTASPTGFVLLSASARPLAEAGCAVAVRSSIAEVARCYGAEPAVAPAFASASAVKGWVATSRRLSLMLKHVAQSKVEFVSTRTLNLARKACLQFYTFGFIATIQTCNCHLQTNCAHA